MRFPVLVLSFALIAGSALASPVTLTSQTRTVEAEARAWPSQVIDVETLSAPDFDLFQESVTAMAQDVGSATATATQTSTIDVGALDFGIDLDLFVDGRAAFGGANGGGRGTSSSLVDVSFEVDHSSPFSIAGMGSTSFITGVFDGFQFVRFEIFLEDDLGGRIFEYDETFDFSNGFPVFDASGSLAPGGYRFFAELSASANDSFSINRYRGELALSLFVPEPSTALLLSLGLFGMRLLRRLPS